MRVIIFVAAVAHHRQFDFVFYLIFMTGIAVDTVMLSVERKILLRVVVKLPRQPVERPVTQLTFRP